MNTTLFCDSNEIQYTVIHQSTTTASPSAFSQDIIYVHGNNESDFWDSNVTSSGGGNETERITKMALTSFNRLLGRRYEYLETLRHIENWTSGTCESPNDLAINLSKKLLEFIGKYINNRGNQLIPKVIMGPIPRGGICIELRSDNENGLAFTITNDQTIDLEYIVNGFYDSFSIEAINISTHFPNYYARLIC